jgi:hypothetical protein
MGAHVIARRRKPPNRLWRRMPMRFAAPALVCACLVGSADRAAAYRPFDGTDAAVADLGELEIEFQPAGVIRSPSTTQVAGPNAIFNYGFAERWELVLQTVAQGFPADAGPMNVPNGAFLKYVLKPGVLQDQPGVSVATEFGPVFANFGGSGTGFSWAGIVSQRWDWGTVHFNADANLTPDQRAEGFLDVIIEGPIKWMVRPVMEIYSDTVVNQTQTYSALVGAIWQVNDRLSFDMAVRYALVNGREVNEIRAGLTFGLPLNFGQPASATSPRRDVR